MRRLAIAFFMLLCAASNAAPAGGNLLDAVRAAAAAVRASKGINPERDAGPELTPFKHTLRAWIESRIADLPQAAEVDAFAARLNAELEAADLTCEKVPPDPHRCLQPVGNGLEDENARGYLGTIALKRLEDGRYLLVTTQMGIRCGFDESFYLYTRKQDRWSLLLQSERDDYRKDVYAPQQFLAVRASPAGVAWNEAAPPPYVLSLGFGPWCSSNWHSLFTRLWHASATNPAPRPLIDTSDTLYMGDYEVAEGSVTSHDALVEFMGRSIDGGSLVRRVVHHYVFGPGDRVRRVGPVALGPDDFVDEWLSGSWNEVSGWTDRSASAASLQRWHGRLHKDFIFGEFDPAPARCRSDRSLWQVAFAEQAEKGNDLPPHYFLVRWEAPYRFTLVRVSARARKGCDLEDPMPDNLGTLFPLQDYR